MARPGAGPAENLAVSDAVACPGQKGNTSWQSVRVGPENVRAGTYTDADTGGSAR
jgi:hypothetical protein